jgi:hypothetical protein
VPLEPEQQGLLGTLVEASRAQSGAERSPFYFDETLSHGDLIDHPGLIPRPMQVSGGDLKLLLRTPLLALSSTGAGSVEFLVTPEGFAYYREWKSLTEQPLERVATEVRSYFDQAGFASEFGAAYARWAQAESLLWGDDSQRDLTTIGHLCREAMQAFATALVDRFAPGDAPGEPAKTKSRMEAVLKARASALGETEAAFLEALHVYWCALDELVQRQEHGAQRERTPLLWEDGRRVVFQTAVVMLEVARSLR